MKALQTEGMGVEPGCLCCSGPWEVMGVPLGKVLRILVLWSLSLGFSCEPQIPILSSVSYQLTSLRNPRDQWGRVHTLECTHTHRV